MKMKGVPPWSSPAISEGYELSEIQQSLEDQIQLIQKRLHHLPYIILNSQRLVVWTDVKEFLLLWCASPNCTVVLSALKYLLNYPLSQKHMHPCTQADQQNFMKQFITIEPDTPLIDLTAIRDSASIIELHDLIRGKHRVSKDPGVIFCNQLVATLTEKYAKMCFQIPYDVLQNTRLLPGTRRNVVKTEQFTWTPGTESSQQLEEDASNVYVPMSCLVDIFPHCGPYLEDMSQWEHRQRDEPLPAVTHCTVEEGLQLSRFMSSYKGYGEPWQSLTSSSLLILWTEFWSGLRYYPHLQDIFTVSDVSLIVVNSQMVDAVDWIKEEPKYEEGYTVMDPNPDMPSALGQEEMQNQVKEIKQSNTETHQKQVPSLKKALRSASKTSYLTQETPDYQNQKAPDNKKELRNSKKTTKDKSKTDSVLSTLQITNKDGTSKSKIYHENPKIQIEKKDSLSGEAQSNKRKSKKSHRETTEIHENNITRKEVGSSLRRSQKSKAANDGLVEIDKEDVQSERAVHRGRGGLRRMNYKNMSEIEDSVLIIDETACEQNETDCVNDEVKSGRGQMKKCSKLHSARKKDKNNSADTDVEVCTSKSSQPKENSEPVMKSEPGSSKLVRNMKQKGQQNVSQNIVIPCQMPIETVSSPAVIVAEDLESGVIPTTQARKPKPKSAVSFASTTKSPTQRQGVSPKNRRTSSPAERPTLRVRSAVFKDNLPQRLRTEIPSPIKLLEKIHQKKAPTKTKPNKPVADEERQSPELLSSTMTVHKKIPPKQLELKPPMKSSVSGGSSGEKFPYRATRSTLLQKDCSSIPVNRNSPSPSGSLMTSINNPIITGYSLQVSPRKCTKSPLKYASKKEISADIKKDSTTIQQLSPEYQDNDCMYLVPESWCHKEMICQNDQANAVSSTSRVPDVTSFQSKRITMWKDMVVSKADNIPGQRLIKSADVVNRKEAVHYYRPTSSIYSPPFRIMQKDCPCIKSALGAVMSRDKEYFTNIQEDKQTYSPEQVPSDSQQSQVSGTVYDVNFGSSSSTTPDIYDEFARRRKPRVLKIEATQIKAKPKPISKMTNPQPQNNKKNAQVSEPEPTKSQPNHHDVGYMSSPVANIFNQKFWNASSSMTALMMQKYQHVNDGKQRNLPFSSQSHHLVTSLPCHSQEMNCRMCKEPGQFWNSPYTYSNPCTAQHQTHQNYNSEQGSPLSAVRQTCSDMTIKPFKAPFASVSPAAEEIHQTLLQSRKQRNIVANSLIEQVANFAGEYSSPLEGDIYPSSENQTESPFSYRFIRDNVSQIQNSPSMEEGLSRIDTQLYFTVVGDNTLHPVTGDTIIPSGAKFYTKTAKHPSTADYQRTSDDKEKHNNEEFVLDSYRLPPEQSESLPANSTKPSEEEIESETTISVNIAGTTPKTQTSSEHLIEETKKKLSINSDVSCNDRPSEQIKEQFEESKKPFKILIASKQVKQKVQAPKKSFREVIEEQRQAKRKAEAELKKKQFWVSARAIGTKYNKSAVSVRSSTTAHKAVQEKKSQASIKSLSSTEEGKDQGDEAQTVRSVSCKSNKSTNDTNKNFRVRDILSAKSSWKKATKNIKCMKKSPVEEPSPPKKVEESTLKILSALKELSLEKSDKTDEKEKQYTERQQRLRSCIERQILGQNKTQRKCHKFVSNVTSKPGSARGKSVILNSKPRSAKSKSAGVSGKSNSVNGKSVKSKVRKSAARKDGIDIDRKSTPDDPVVTAVERHQMEETENIMKDRPDDSGSVDNLKAIEGQQIHSVLQSNKKQKRTFITQGSFKEIIVQSENEKRNEHASRDKECLRNRFEPNPVNVNMNNVALNECIQTPQNSPVESSVRLSNHDRKTMENGDMQSGSAVKVIYNGDSMVNIDTQEVPTPQDVETEHELLKTTVSSPFFEDKDSEIFENKPDATESAESVNNVGPVLSIQEPDDSRGFKVVLGSGNGEYTNIQPDNPSYQELMKFYQEHGLTQMFTNAMSYFQEFSKEHTADPLLADLDLVTLNEENSEDETHPDNGPETVLSEGEINVEVGISNEKLVSDNKMKKAFTSQLYTLSKNASFSPNSSKCTKTPDKNSDDTALDPVNVEVVTSYFTSSNCPDNIQHADNIFEVFNAQLLEMNESAKESTENQNEDPVIANVMLSDCSESMISVVSNGDDEDIIVEEIDVLNNSNEEQQCFADEKVCCQDICIAEEMFEDDVVSPMTEESDSSETQEESCQRVQVYTSKKVNMNTMDENIDGRKSKVSEADLEVSQRSQDISSLMKVNAKLCESNSMVSKERKDNKTSNNEVAETADKINVIHNRCTKKSVTDNVNGKTENSNEIKRNRSSKNERNRDRDIEMKNNSKEIQTTSNKNNLKDKVKGGMEKIKRILSSNKQRTESVHNKEKERADKIKDIPCNFSKTHLSNKVKDRKEGMKTIQGCTMTMGANILKDVDPAVRCAALGLRDSTTRHSHCEVYIDVDGVGEDENTRSTNEATLQYYSDSETESASENEMADSDMDVDDENDEDYIPDVSASEDEPNEQDIEEVLRDGSVNVEISKDKERHNVDAHRKKSLSKLEQLRKSFQKKYDVKTIATNQSKLTTDKSRLCRGQNEVPDHDRTVTPSKPVKASGSKAQGKGKKPVLKRLQENDSSSSSNDEEILNISWKLTELERSLMSNKAAESSDSSADESNNDSDDGADGVNVKQIVAGTSEGAGHESKQEGSNPSHGQNKAGKKKVKRKSTKDEKDESAPTEEERRQKEEQLAAEAFIRQQQMYYEIIKNCHNTPQPANEESETPDVEELLMEIPVQGDRDISRAAAEAEKALEGTGSLSDGEEDEGTFIEDLVNSCTYQLVEDEDKINLGGVCFFRDFVLPFVYINGYKFTTLKDALKMFQPRVCGSACRIPRSVLQKHKPLMKTFSTWDQVYKFELIKMKKGPAIMTGDVLLKLDCLVSQLPDLVDQVVSLHKGTKLKNSKNCSVSLYNNLTGRTNK